MRAIPLKIKGKKFASELFEKGTYNSVIIQFIYLIGGALVSHGAVFGSYAPFGAAFCAAVPYKNALSAVVGSIFGYILLYPKGSFRYAATVITILALRWLLNDLKNITQSKLFAPLTAMIPLLCTGMVIVIASDRGQMDYIMCLTEAVLAAAGAYFFDRTIRITAGRKGILTYDQQEIACVVMTGCIFLLSANNLTVGNISIGRILAVMTVLFCAYYGSVSGGCIGGAATGIIFGIGSNDLTFITACYTFGGLMSGLFSYIGRIGAAAAFVLCGSIVLFRDGVTVQTAGVLYETIIACVFFLFIPKEMGNRLSAFLNPKNDPNSSEGLRRSLIMRLDMASNSLKNISQAVNSVARKLSDYYSADVESIYTSCIDENCSRCGMRAFCWQDEQQKKEDKFAEITPILSSGENVTESDIRKLFNKKCCKAEEMAQAVNRHYSNYQSFIAAESRVSQIRGVIAGQFSGLGDILRDFKEEFESFESCDTGVSERVCAYLRTNGFVPIECGCRIDRFGRMNIELELADSDRKLLKMKDCVKEISRVCGRTLAAPRITALGNKTRAVFSEKPKFDVQIGSSQHICGRGTLCGDSFNYFNDGQGHFVTVISDGMGTGGRAAVDASMAVSIMSKLLKSGFGCDCALSVTNSALMVKSQDESLATVDLAVFDLFSGNLEIMKAGSPVTFVRQSGKVVRIEPTSLPAGILTDIKFTHDTLSLKDGDIVVMVSDGAISVSDKWIAAMLRDFEGDDIQELVNDIIDEAMIGNNLVRDDDITVIAYSLHS